VRGKQARQIAAAHVAQSKNRPWTLAVIRVNESLKVGAGRTPLTAEEQARRRQLADQSMEVLRQEVSVGTIHHRAVVEHHPDFEPLRDLEDFGELLEKLDQRAAAATGNL
jgi:hypothetical protein